MAQDTLYGALLIVVVFAGLAFLVLTDDRGWQVAEAKAQASDTAGCLIPKWDGTCDYD